MEEELNYYDLDALFNKCVSGELDIHQPLEVSNKLKNRRHEISFLHHLLIQCKTHNIPLIEILSQLRYRIKSRILELVNSNAFIRHYIQNVIYEWSHDITPFDIFIDGLDELEEFPLDGSEEKLFDYSKFIDEKQSCQKAGGLLVKLEKDIGENQIQHVPFERAYSTEVEDRIRDIHHQCYDCMGRVKRNIQEVDSKYDSLEPKYMEVLLDLSTKCKSAYLEHSSRSDDSSISRLITDKNNNDIPDNIHTIFLNYTIVLNMIQKEMKFVLISFQKLMENIQDKTVMVSGFMDSLNLGDFIEEPGLGQEELEGVSGVEGLEEESNLPEFIQSIIDSAKGASFFD